MDLSYLKINQIKMRFRAVSSGLVWFHDFRNHILVVWFGLTFRQTTWFGLVSFLTKPPCAVWFGAVS